MPLPPEPLHRPAGLLGHDVIPCPFLTYLPHACSAVTLFVETNQLLKTSAMSLRVQFLMLSRAEVDGGEQQSSPPASPTKQRSVSRG